MHVQESLQDQHALTTADDALHQPGPGATLFVAMPSRRDVPNVMVPVDGRVDRNCRPSVSCKHVLHISRLMCEFR